MNLFTYSTQASARIFAAVAMSALLLTLVPLQQASAQVPACTIEITSTTDTFVEQTGNDAVAVPLPLHLAWTALIPGAAWIWGDDQTATTSGDVTYTFQNQFGFVGNVTSATLYVASDNGHSASLNGGANNDGGSSFNNVQTYNLATSSVAQGDNELLVSVTNTGPQGNITDNPAGALYRLVIVGTPTTDSDCSINYGDEVPVLGCTDDAASNYNPLATNDNEEADSCDFAPPSVCDIGENLLENSSFEEPVADQNSHNGGFWEVFASIPFWFSNTNEVEVWKNMFGGASEGIQNVELDVNSPSILSQTVTTVPGATYELSFDFAARSSNAADNSVEALAGGVLLYSVITGDTNWVGHTTSFVATTTTTNISFADKGTGVTGEGSLLDNTVLCLVSEPVIVVPPRTFKIFGYVWYDDNQNDLWDDRENNSEEVEAELPLGGRIVTIANDDYSTTTTTNSEGYYEFEVPAGTWTITETLPEGWEHTTAESHTVTVPQMPVSDVTFLDVVREFFIPTAHAQLIAIPVQREYGEYNFGNDEVATIPSGGGGGGSLMRPSNTPTTGSGTTDDTDDSLPTPTVLGEQVSVVPAGAPAAGGGGTSPLSISLPTLVAAFVTRQRLDV